jgi:hypothetical protein
MKIIEIKDGQNYQVDGSFLIRIINDKPIIITDSKCFSFSLDEPFKGFEDDKEAVYLYWDYCENSIRKHVYYYYSLIDKTMLALIDDDNYVSGIEKHKPSFISDWQYKKILEWYSVLANWC